MPRKSDGTAVPNLGESYRGEWKAIQESVVLKTISDRCELCGSHLITDAHTHTRGYSHQGALSPGRSRRKSWVNVGTLN